MITHTPFDGIIKKGIETKKRKLTKVGMCAAAVVGDVNVMEVFVIPDDAVVILDDPKK